MTTPKRHGMRNGLKGQKRSQRLKDAGFHLFKPQRAAYRLFCCPGFLPLGTRLCLQSVIVIRSVGVAVKVPYRRGGQWHLKRQENRGLFGVENPEIKG